MCSVWVILASPAPGVILMSKCDRWPLDMVMPLTGRVYMIVIFNLLLSDFLETNVYTSLYSSVLWIGRIQ